MIYVVHSNVKGSHWGQHKYGDWDKRATYANGQEDPNAKPKKSVKQKLGDMRKAHNARKYTSLNKKADAAFEKENFYADSKENIANKLLKLQDKSYRQEKKISFAEFIGSDKMLNKALDKIDSYDDAYRTFMERYDYAEMNEAKWKYKKMNYEYKAKRYVQHSGVKGMHWGQHKYGDWDKRATYANGQDAPDNKQQKKELERIKNIYRNTKSPTTDNWKSYKEAVDKLSQTETIKKMRQSLDAYNKKYKKILEELENLDDIDENDNRIADKTRAYVEYTKEANRLITRLIGKEPSVKKEQSQYHSAYMLLLRAVDSHLDDMPLISDWLHGK